ncbi:MarR family transcriptional regulator [Phycicoccus sp. HDW14]|uniref:MarR family winged helix-turn-helix transcriptional regulator n=1 Tax=Phycicoccus sp. HDW14 TaxID=2714941 RepID=UPI00140E7F5D|nr:MarR family transcriptional regulator [Phycicoccus sp. HDW14]QIM22335.1 MarR family transcriptional regulator [Phycicoccus sp. HDW14]
MDPRSQLVASLGDAMQRYQRSVQAYDDAVGRALDLGPADLRCLDWLVDGPKTAGALATATGLRPAATTALIDRLEARGLVERVRDESDRRRVLVRMTEEGSRETYAMYAPLVDEGTRLFDGVTDAQLRAMGGLLERMREMTDRHAERLRGDGT